MGRAVLLGGIGRAAIGFVGPVVLLAACMGMPGTPEPVTPLPTPEPHETMPLRPSDAPCLPTLQAEIDAASPGAVLDLRGCEYAGSATIDQPLTIIGATLRVPAGMPGISITADDVTLDSIVLTGAQSRVFDFDEAGVVAWSTPESPIRGLTIRYSEIASFGGYGTYLRNVASVHLEANDVHDIVYAGLMVLSGSGGAIEGNVVRRIGLEGAEANENNAYGIVLTTQGVDEPRTTDYLVSGNTVEDVPSWHALDTHGGSRIIFRENTVRRSMRGIFITTDSADHRPTDIEIIDNQLLSPAPVDANLAAITLYRGQGVTISGNTVIGWGENNFYRDFEGESTDVTIEDNHVDP